MPEGYPSSRRKGGEPKPNVVRFVSQRRVPLPLDFDLAHGSRRSTERCLNHQTLRRALDPGPHKISRVPSRLPGRVLEEGSRGLSSRRQSAGNPDPVQPVGLVADPVAEPALVNTPANAVVARHPSNPWAEPPEHRERRGAAPARRDEGGIAALFARGATQSEATQHGCIAARMPGGFYPRACLLTWVPGLKGEPGPSVPRPGCRWGAVVGPSRAWPFGAV